MDISGDLLYIDNIVDVVEWFTTDSIPHIEPFLRFYDPVVVSGLCFQVAVSVISKKRTRIFYYIATLMKKYQFRKYFEYGKG